MKKSKSIDVMFSNAGAGTMVLVLSVWFGLVTGLVEGISFLVLQAFDQLTYVSLEIVWISPLIYLLVFFTGGLGLWAINRLSLRLPVLDVAVFVFTVLAFLDWLLLFLYPRISPYAILILAAGLATAIFRLYRRHQADLLHFWRRGWVWLACITLVVFAGIEFGIWAVERTSVASLPALPEKTPNVLLIVVDALRADHLSSYGYSRQTSPYLDRLASEGVLFENAISPSSYTLPSHASLLTGRYVFEHGVEWNTPRVLGDCSYPTLPEALQEQGFRTAAFSANVFWFTQEFGFSRGFIHFDDFFHSFEDMALRTIYGRVFEKLVLQRLGFEDIPARKRASDINRALLQWVDQDPELPFFAFLNLMDTHDPYLPPQPFRNKFSRLENPGGILNWRVGRSNPEMTVEQIQREKDAYDGAIAYVDKNIHLLLEQLDARGQLDRTLVVVVSDHGEAFGEHRSFLHGNSLYREEIHVPLIMWWPGHLPAGQRISQPVSITALPATILSLIGRSAEELFPGPPLQNLWTGQTGSSEWPDPLAELLQKGWADSISPIAHGSIKSIFTPIWQYIEHTSFGAELYDWAQDPLESNDLSKDAQSEETFAAFSARIQKMISHDSICR